MSTLHDVVYCITPAGYSALRNANEPLNLDLKTVLTLVDGICPVAQYVPFLLAFDPLAEKFQILERMGYLAPTGRISTQAVSAFGHSVSQGQPLSRLPRIDSLMRESGFTLLV